MRRSLNREKSTPASSLASKLRYWKSSGPGWNKTRRKKLYIENESARSLRLFRTMLTLLVLAGVVLMTTACSSSIRPCPVPPKPVIPNSLKMPCPKLAPLEDKSMAAMAGKIVEISGQYYRCADKHKALVDTWNGSSSK